MKAKNGTCEVRFRRDALNRLIEEQIDGVVVESRYDAAGNHVGRRTTLGHETAYEFDGGGGLVGVMFGHDPRWMDFRPKR